MSAAMAPGAELLVKRVHPQAVLPARGSEHAAGFDLAAAEGIVAPAGGKALVKTGLSIAVPHGTYARIAPRSGLALKRMINVGAGVVDYDYRGEVGVVLFNHGSEDFQISPGDRVAQLILEKVSMVGCTEVESLEETARGAGGFGSTGVADGLATATPSTMATRPTAAPNTQLPSPLEQVMRVQRTHPEAVLPIRGSSDAAGFDLAAAEVTVAPAGGKALVKTGLKIAIPSGTYARIAPRSGLAVKKMIQVGAGVVDFDYRGEVGVVLFNHGSEDFHVQVGDRIAQLILERVDMAPCKEVDSLDVTERGAGGFGSTGVECQVKRARSEGSDESKSLVREIDADMAAELQKEIACLRHELLSLRKLCVSAGAIREAGA